MLLTPAGTLHLFSTCAALAELALSKQTPILQKQKQSLRELPARLQPKLVWHQDLSTYPLYGLSDPFSGEETPLQSQALHEILPPLLS